ncbi:MAG: peroxiredoxin family protein [Nitrospinota bacterium]
MVQTMRFAYHSTVFLFILIVLALVGETALAASEASPGDYFKALGVYRFEKRPPAPQFTLPDVGGNPVRLSDFKGKAVLLNFFATWCTPCWWEMPEMEKLHQTYKDKGFAVVAVSIDRNRELIPPFLEKFKLTFPTLHDPDLQVARRYGFRGPPLTYLIDAEGRVVGGAAGPREWFSKEAQKLIESLLPKG